MSKRASIIHKTLYALGALVGLVHFALVLSTMVVGYDGIEYSDPLAARIMGPINAEMKAEFYKQRRAALPWRIPACVVAGLGAVYYAVHLVVRHVRPASSFLHIACDLSANFTLCVALIIVLAGKFLLINILTFVTAGFAILQCVLVGITFLVESILAFRTGLPIRRVLNMSFDQLATRDPGDHSPTDSLSPTATRGKEFV